MNATTAATRKTAAGTKVYIHTNCSCAKVNGKILKGIDTVEAAEQFAADNDFPFTLCKTSQVDEVEAAELDDEDDEEGFEGGGEPEFEIVVDNVDQYGKQRRDAIAALVEVLGAEMTFKGIKNRHRTGNDAFAVQITKAPGHLQPLVNSFLEELDEEVPDVVDEAKAEGLAEGWDANTRQKHYKKAARTYITDKGVALAERLR
jgi:hypothetical protein